MSMVSLTGKATQIINGYVLTQLPDGDVTKITHPNAKWVLKTGKNGNTIYAYNYTGLQVEVEQRVLLGGQDDVFLNSIILQADANPAGFVLISGVFVQNVGDGTGNITPVTFTLNGGVITHDPDASENTSGTTEQAVAVYRMIFSNAPRTIGM